MLKYIKIVFVLSFFLLTSCASFFNQPLYRQPSRVGEFSQSTKKLLDIPEAEAPVEVAVYNFSDQTGQYKPVENGSTFSTAVTQGATTILIKALEDSGWFIPIERENLSNLSTERNIIRNTKQEYIKNLNPNEPPLPPLLYAGLILEGGIVSYDTNIVTGGLGARYFGLGASSRYRQDRITVYLRAVSTSNGEILKTVYVSKTILSQALDANFFRFVKFQRLLEAESGITQNEPVQIAVKDAVEKAVHDLIMEGIIDNFWSSKEGAEVDRELVENYLAEKEATQSIELYNRAMIDLEHKNTVSFSGGGSLIDGDYETKKLGFLTRLEFRRNITPHLSVGVSGGVLELNSGKQFKGTFGDLNFNSQIDLLPKDDLSPFVYAGAGLVREFDGDVSQGVFGTTFFKMQYGAGIQYHFSPKWGLKLFAEHSIVFSDELDRFDNGRRDDFYYNLGIGINYKFSFSKNKNKTQFSLEPTN